MSPPAAAFALVVAHHHLGRTGSGRRANHELHGTLVLNQTMNRALLLAILATPAVGSAQQILEVGSPYE